MYIKQLPQGSYHQKLIDKASQKAGLSLINTDKNSIARNYKSYSGTWSISKFSLPTARKALYLRIAQKNLSLTISVEYDLYKSGIDGYVKFRELDMALSVIPEQARKILGQKTTLTVKGFNDFNDHLIDILVKVIKEYDSIVKQLYQRSFNLLVRYCDSQLMISSSRFQQDLMQKTIEAGINIDNVNSSHPIWYLLLRIRYEKVPESTFNRLGYWLIENIEFDLKSYIYYDKIYAKLTVGERVQLVDLLR